jgi:TolA-binding protein
LFFLLNLYSLELNVNYAKNKNPYEVLTITNNEKFTCSVTDGSSVECLFDKVPSTPVFKTSTVFFNINPVFENGRFKLDIKIKTGFVLKAFDGDLYNGALMGTKLAKTEKWVIIASKKIPFIDTKPSGGLNFYFVNSPKPYIGTIDENGNPVQVDKQAKDVLKYFEIKKSYQNGLDVIDEINSFIKEYPDSVFLPDILYMRLKVYDDKNQPDEVISLAKEWIKKYAFNENLPKVLLLIAKNYTKLGFMSDASYFYQRIITEYPNTKEAYMAMIYWADQMYITGENKKALMLYKKALYSTKDVEIASLAAMRLAQRYMDKGDIKTAFEYYKRVYQANKGFILKDPHKAYELAKTLASHNLYSLAVQIGEDLLGKLKKLDDLYEPLEYHLAIWSYEKQDYEKANYWINRYLKEFPYGDYSDQLSSLRDKVLFEVNDGNITQQLAKIDEIIKKYKGQQIAQKALYKKIILLEKLKKYDEILKMADKIKTLDDSIMKNKEAFLQKTAKLSAIELLNAGRCFDVVRVIKTYKITLDKKFDDKLYQCAVKTRNFDFASVICNKYLDSPDDKIFVKWIKRKIKALEGMQDYGSVVTAIDDLCRVSKQCYEYRLKKFFALWKLKRYKEALEVAKKLDKTKDIRNCDAFIKIVNLSLKNNDTLTAAVFAEKIIKLQNMFKAYPYSPFADFTFAKYTKNKKEAVKVLKNLITRVNGEDLARVYYNLANLTGNKKYLNRCLKVKNSTLWKGLCKDALNLF